MRARLAVVDIARKYLQTVHKGALDDSRLTLKIGDGFEHIVESEEQYDLIVLDLTDPGGPSESLYTPDFYRACALRLKPVGAMTLHLASPVAHPDRIRSCLANLRAAFPLVTPYLTSVPLYGGLWMMACVSQTLDPKSLSAREVDRRISQRNLPTSSTTTAKCTGRLSRCPISSVALSAEVLREVAPAATQKRS